LYKTNSFLVQDDAFGLRRKVYRHITGSYLSDY